VDIFSVAKLKNMPVWLAPSGNADYNDLMQCDLIDVSQQVNVQLEDYSAFGDVDDERGVYSIVLKLREKA
jgi:hypothetical protein